MKKSIKYSAILTAAFAIMVGPAIAQDTVSPFKQLQPKTNATEMQQTPQNLHQPTKKIKIMDSLKNPANTLGLAYPEAQINKAKNYVKIGKLAEAQRTLESLKEWLDSATENHADLFRVLKEIETAKVQADHERELALQFALLRDKATFELGKVYIKEGKLTKAVDSLVAIVKSQPKTQMGFDAYDMLQKIGFTNKVVLEQNEGQ